SSAWPPDQLVRDQVNVLGAPCHFDRIADLGSRFPRRGSFSDDEHGLVVQPDAVTDEAGCEYGINHCARGTVLDALRVRADRHAFGPNESDLFASASF